MILINQNKKAKVKLAAIFSIFIVEEVLIKDFEVMYFSQASLYRLFHSKTKKNGY